MARNTIVILVVIVATILLVIIRYDIGSTIVVIIVIGSMKLEIMVVVMNIVVGYHCPCCMSYIGRYHGHNCCCPYCRGRWVSHCLHRRSRSGQD